MLRATNQELRRAYHRRLVPETIRLGAAIARAGIAKRVGLASGG